MVIVTITRIVSNQDGEREEELLIITRIEAIVVRPPALNRDIADGSQDDLLIKIHTDEGITGIGEVDSAPEAVKAIVNSTGSHAIARSLQELLVGQDPLETEALWWKAYRGLSYVGRRGIALHAISGIDIALWDIRGKAEGKAICELIGIKHHSRMRAYASMLMPTTPEEVKEQVSSLCGERFTAVKLGWGPLGRNPDNDILLARAAREAAGENDVMIDAGLGYGRDATTAIRVAREFEELEIRWLEEPFEPDEYEAYAELADTVDIPIAAGEQEATVWGFRELIDRGRVDIVQPDVTRCGGISELIRIADLARGRGIQTVPHAWKSGIVKAASLHANAALPDALLQEYCISNSLINTQLTQESFPLDSEGYVLVPTGPGLGVELDDEFVERYRVD